LPIKNGRFEGKGINKKGDYTVLGEIAESQYLSATYKNVKFPTVGYFGSFTTKVHVRGNSMEGYWQGRVADGSIKGGKIVSVKAMNALGDRSRIWDSAVLCQENCRVVSTFRGFIELL